MAIHCIFHVPGSPGLCQILLAGQSPALTAVQRRHLERRYCTSGGFILCPLFERVERGLASYHATAPRGATACAR